MSRFTNFVILLVAILALFPLYTRFKASAAPIPPGVYLAGVDVSAQKDLAAMRSLLEPIYRQTIEVRFAERRLALNPDQVDFHLNVEQMEQEASQYLEGLPFLDIATRYALGFEQQRRDVPIRFSLNLDKLRAWLQSIATQQDHGPLPPRVFSPQPQWSSGLTLTTNLPDNYVGSYTRDWTWVSGGPGHALDVEASIPKVVAALTRLDQRTAVLVTRETPAPPPALAVTSAVISQTLSNFPGFGSVYIHDLTTGEEAFVDADVSFSGMSTQKIAIAAAVMQKLPNGIDKDDPDSRQLGLWMDYALGESNNQAANQLLIFLGDGDLTRGAQHFTEFVRGLGFVNTFMQSGYEWAVSSVPIQTPGNQRSDWNTNPDPNLQSDPTEMGRMLSAIYLCTQGKGLLIEKYPNDFTAEECWSILYYMTHDEFQEMIWAGLPNYKQEWIVHKHGFAFETHSDVALIWGPSGPYVVSIFFYRKGWMDWETSNGAMQAISRIVWNFYEFRRQQTGAEEAPKPPMLQPPPGYRAFKKYIPVASRGFQ